MRSSLPTRKAVAWGFLGAGAIAFSNGIVYNNGGTLFLGVLLTSVGFWIYYRMR